MKQEKTRVSRFILPEELASMPESFRMARLFLIRWNRAVKIVLVFFLFSIIFIVPAGWLPGVALWGKHMGLSAQQTRPASMGRLLWTWISRGKGMFALRKETQMTPLVIHASDEENVNEIAEPALFKKAKTAPGQDTVKGVYFRLQEAPESLDLDRALNRALKGKGKVTGSLTKGSSAQKELEQMWQQSSQAQQAADLMQKRRIAQGAFMGAEVPQE